jgi:flavin-dependent dehydrogenase
VDALRDRGVLSGLSSRQHFTPYQIPVGGTLGRTASRRVILAGDAGGFVNGITAEGIYYAMVSGDLAARALSGGGPAAYQPLWRKEIGRELADAVLVQRELLTAPARIDAIVDAAPASRNLSDEILRYLQGEISYARARRRVLWSLPTSAARLFVRHVRSLLVKPGAVAGAHAGTVSNLANAGARSMKEVSRVSR